VEIWFKPLDEETKDDLEAYCSDIRELDRLEYYDKEVKK